MTKETQEAIARIKNKKEAMSSNDAIELSTKYAEQAAKEDGKEYTKEDRDRDTRNAFYAMNGINREDDWDR